MCVGLLLPPKPTVRMSQTEPWNNGGQFIFLCLFHPSSFFYVYDILYNDGETLVHFTTVPYTLNALQAFGLEATNYDRSD